MNDLADQLAKINADIDEQISKLRKHSGSPLDAAMLDKLLRPFAVMIHVNRAAETDAVEFQEASAWSIATLMCELLLNTQNKHNPDEMTKAANKLLINVTTHLSNMLNASVPQFNSAAQLAKPNPNILN